MVNNSITQQNQRWRHYTRFQCLMCAIKRLQPRLYFRGHSEAKGRGRGRNCGKGSVVTYEVFKYQITEKVFGKMYLNTFLIYCI